MAIRIPRAETVRTVEAVAPEAGQSDYSGLDRIGRQLTQVGSQLRENQQNLDLAEAKTRIYAARKLAQSQADEQGLYGDDYTQFMSTAVAKARDEVSGLTELPEVRRALTNEGMVRQQADEIEFRAEGFRRQIQNDNARIERTVDMLGHGAQNEFWIASGDIDPQLYELMDNGQDAGESRTGFTEEQRRLAGEEARSVVGYRAGLEMIEGWTVNGQGDPWGLLQILNNEGHEFTGRLTEAHRYELKRLAEQKMKAISSRASSMKEAITERLDEWNSNIKEKVDSGGFVTQREIDEGRRLYGRLGEMYQVDARIEQWPDDYQMDPDKSERARRVQTEFNENMVLAQYQEASVALTDEELQALSVQLEREHRQPILADGVAQDDAVAGPDGPEQTGEFRQKEMQMAAVNAELERRRSARDQGETIKEYIVSVGGDPMAAMDVDFTDMDRALEIAQVRASELGGASQWSGYPAPLFTADETKEFTDRIAEGGIQPQELTAWVSLMAEMPEDSAREQMRLFDQNAPWMRGMMFAIETGNQPVSEHVARGATMVMTGATDNFWSGEGDEQAVRSELSSIFRNTFISSPGVGQDMTETAMLYMYGTMEKMSGNSAGDVSADKVAAQMFRGGADVVNGRLYPRPSSTVHEGLTAHDVFADIDIADFNGYVLPKIGMDDAVSDDMMGESGPQRLADRMREGGDEVMFEPNPGRPGEYFVLSNNPADAIFLTQSGYFMDESGRPLRVDLNNFYERRQHTMNMSEAERERRGITSWYQGNVQPAGSQRRRRER